MRSKHDPFLQVVWRTVRQYAMLESGERVVVAVSGGADSVATLYALNALAAPMKLTLCVAHVNHGLRATAADDEVFVGTLAEQLGLPLHVRRMEPGTIGHRSVEATARVWRYHYLKEIARAAGASKIATGHTLDDQAETILMRLLRGAGWHGLRGVLPVREDGVIRPLIQCSRDEVQRYLHQRGVRWLEDETNWDRRFLRNRIRHFVMPMLAQINPRAARTLALVSDHARSDWEAFRLLVEEKMAVCTNPETALIVPRLRLLDSRVQRPLMHAWLTRCLGDTAIAATTVERVLQLVRSGKEGEVVVSARTGRVAVEKGRVIFRPAGSLSKLRLSHNWGPYPLQPGTQLYLPNGWVLCADECDPSRFASESRDRECCAAYFDARALSGSLAVRPARPGDRIVPFGMTGSRKLQDVFTDRHVHRSERWGRPVITSGETILWVPGLLRSNHARLTPATKWALKFELFRSAPDQETS